MMPCMSFPVAGSSIAILWGWTNRKRETEWDEEGGSHLHFERLPRASLHCKSKKSCLLYDDTHI